MSKQQQWESNEQPEGNHCESMQNNSFPAALKRSELYTQHNLTLPLMKRMRERHAVCIQKRIG